MKRLISLLVCLLLVFPEVACADFALINNENVRQLFQLSDDPTDWVESTDLARAYVWYATWLDIRAYDPTFTTLDNEKTLFFIGKDSEFNFIHLYVRDRTDTYCHITMCPSWGYFIYEDVGISQKKAKETLGKLTKHHFEMTFEEVESEITAANNTDDSQHDDSSTNESQEVQTDNKTVANLPSMTGPFSGNTITVNSNGSTFTVRKEFKEALDKYCEYFDNYIALAKSLSVNDPNYLSQYTSLMEKYLEVVQAVEYLDGINDEELTKDEAAYLLWVITKVNTDLLSVISK